MRDSAGISPDFARCQNPDRNPGRDVIIAVGPRLTADGYLPHMKLILPVVVAAVAAVAVAVVKLRETDPLPEPPDGVWELDEYELGS